MNKSRKVSSFADAEEVLGTTLGSAVEAEHRAEVTAQEAQGKVMDDLASHKVQGKYLKAAPKDQRDKQVLLFNPVTKKPYRATLSQIRDAAHYMARKRLSPQKQKRLDMAKSDMSESSWKLRREDMQGLGSTVNKWAEGLIKREKAAQLEELQQAENAKAEKAGREAETLSMSILTPKRPAIERIQDKIQGIVRICVGTEKFPRGVKRGEAADQARALYSVFGLTDPDTDK
jgi:hypothetical protein